jgi:hypothetical protein
MQLLLRPVVLRPVDVEEEVLRLLPDEHLLAECFSLYLYAEIELFVKRALKGTETGVEDDPREITDYRLLFLQLLL